MLRSAACGEADLPAYGENNQDDRCNVMPAEAKLAFKENATDFIEKVTDATISRCCGPIERRACSVGIWQVCCGIQC